jgi:hypothetical protein
MHSPSSLLLACASFPANALCCLLCCLSSHEECRNKWRPCYARLLPTTGATTGDFPLSSSPPVPRLVFLFPDQFPACRRLLGPFRLGSLLFFLAAFVRLWLCAVCVSVEFVSVRAFGTSSSRIGGTVESSLHLCFAPSKKLVDYRPPNSSLCLLPHTVSLRAGLQVASAYSH